MRLRVMVWFVGALYCTSMARAEQRQATQATVAVTGSVIGMVYAQETQRPIRLAQVQLQSVESVAETNSGGNSRGGGRGGSVQVRTEVDGSFTASGLTPGDYYATASAAGYIGERALLLAAVANGSDPGQLLAAIPVVHVAAEQTSTVTVSLQRGGTLSGRVVWEDESPASGVQVNAASSKQAVPLPPPLQGLSLNSPGPFATTDDRGEFRITGLTSDDYVLMATVQSGVQVQFGNGGVNARGGQQFPSLIRVYAPGVFRKSAAKSYSVRAGDEHGDVRLVVDLRSLRTVSGYATNAGGGEAVRSGRASVVDSADPSLLLQGGVETDGSFTIRFVPPGSYTLQVNGASTAVQRGRGEDSSAGVVAVRFQPASQAVVVTDVDLSGIAVALTPMAATGR